MISPGLAPGLLTMNGNFNQLPNGVLVIEVTGLAPGQFDVLAVSGDVTLNGTLEVRFLDGFLPKQGDHVDFLQAGGTVSGNFAKITFPQLPWLQRGRDADKREIAPDGSQRRHPRGSRRFDVCGTIVF